MKRIIGSVDFCQRCGAEYTVRGAMQKFCRACAIELGLDRSDTRDDPLMFAARNCVVCGKKFEVLGRRNLCCSPECSKVHQRIKAAECGNVRRRKAGILPRSSCTGYRWVVPSGKKYAADFVVRGHRCCKSGFLTPEEAHAWAAAERKRIIEDSSL